MLINCAREYCIIIASLLNNIRSCKLLSEIIVIILFNIEGITLRVFTGAISTDLTSNLQTLFQKECTK